MFLSLKNGHNEGKNLEHRDRLVSNEIAARTLKHPRSQSQKRLSHDVIIEL